MGLVDTPGTGQSVAVRGHYAYVCGSERDVVDIENPRQPQIVTTFETAYYDCRITESDHLLLGEASPK